MTRTAITSSELENAKKRINTITGFCFQLSTYFTFPNVTKRLLREYFIYATETVDNTGFYLRRVGYYLQYSSR